MNKTVTKKIHYRYAQITKNDKTLQELFDEAINSNDLKLAANRQENFNSNSKDFRMVNAVIEDSTMIFGQLIFVCPEQAQAILNMEEGAKTYTINPFSLNEDEDNDKKKIKKEFINSILYFLIYRNHVVIMQSKALTTRDLETHVFWVLNKANLLQVGSEFALQTQPPKETMDLIAAAPVKSIRIGSDLNVIKSDEKENNKTNKTDTKAITVKNAFSMDILKSIVPNLFTENRNLSDCFDSANLQVNLEILYMRKTTTKGQEFIDSIATSLRHTVNNEDDIKIFLKDGGVLSGDKLQLSTSINIDIKNNLMDETSILKQMKDWLTLKINNEDINE